MRAELDFGMGQSPWQAVFAVDLPLDAATAQRV
jgi:hypothetical protein